MAVPRHILAKGEKSWEPSSGDEAEKLSSPLAAPYRLYYRPVLGDQASHSRVALLFISGAREPPALTLSIYLLHERFCMWRDAGCARLG